MRDGSRSSRNVARVAMDAAISGAFAPDESAPRTAKSCGPGAATVASIRPACAGSATVTTNAAHRGEHEVSRKAIARGKPGCLGCTCLIRVRFFLPLHTRRCGRSQRPAFPAPSVRERDDEFEELGRKSCRENEKACSLVISEKRSPPLSPLTLRRLRSSRLEGLRPPAGPASFETRVPRSSG
jgi:hypothetical protein